MRDREGPPGGSFYPAYLCTETILGRPGFVLVSVMGYEGAGEVQTPVPGAPTYRGGGQCLAEAIAAGPRTSTLLPSALAQPTAPVKASWVLPAAADRAKDLGLINIAYSLLLGVASLVAGVVLGLTNSYRAHFALAGLVTVIARITVTRVRSVSWPPIPNRYEAAY